MKRHGLEMLPESLNLQRPLIIPNIVTVSVQGTSGWHRDNTDMSFSWHSLLSRQREVRWDFLTPRKQPEDCLKAREELTTQYTRIDSRVVQLLVLSSPLLSLLPFVPSKTSLPSVYFIHLIWPPWPSELSVWKSFSVIHVILIMGTKGYLGI